MITYIHIVPFKTPKDASHNKMKHIIRLDRVQSSVGSWRTAEGREFLRTGGSHTEGSVTKSPLVAGRDDEEPRIRRSQVPGMGSGP